MVCIGDVLGDDDTEVLCGEGAFISQRLTRLRQEVIGAVNVRQNADNGRCTDMAAVRRLSQQLGRIRLT